MITRGYYIGEIIDNISNLSFQIENRSRLNLLDLNRYIEDFFKEVLNKTLNTNLINLNAEKINAPGLDLADISSGIAFQITSQKTSDKINSTLEKITPEQLRLYPFINIFIIGKKQNSYSINQEHLDRCNFDIDRNIWDINRLLKAIIDLPLERLKSLYDYVENEVLRVKIELEIPDAQGKFPTNLEDFVENIPIPQMGSGEKFKNYLERYGATILIQNVKDDLELFSMELKKLPRVTRQFYSLLLLRKDEGSGSDGYFTFNLDRLKRICNYPDLDGEIKLLNQGDFLTFNPAEFQGESDQIHLAFYKKTKNDYFLVELISFIEETNLDLRKIIVHLDFADF